MLKTNLIHLETEQDFEDTIKNNANVMICCGRMGPMCIPVYAMMEELRPHYQHVVFTDMDFDNRRTAVHIRRLPECSSFKGLPFTVYFKNSKVARATSSLQTKIQIMKILDEVFPSDAKE